MAVTSYVASKDGTRLAFDRLGDGAPVVVVGGLLCGRSRTRGLADALASQLASRRSVINYDRRGRGASGDAAPYRVEREVEDLAAIIDRAGGDAAVYGHSSGAGLALRAAACGLPIRRLVLHEPPYGPDDPESMAAARDLGAAVAKAVEAGRPDDAVRAFFTAADLPPEVVEAMASDPTVLALAPTMPYDHAVMGDEHGGTVPADLVRSVAVPTLVLAGDRSPAFFLDTARRLIELLPSARQTVIHGHGHDAPPDVVAPIVAAFLLEQDDE